ncbi:MAG: sensor histidine kinase [Candidatus Cohnella colombiensis]|uniref:histidine kinase n=1 Tax=Candidatus Cohnella colombiensis TaxID=3121368 RepID=A0AA95EU14_9BACL|nr:MAG: sensor histidine kinase [Cohnella sp.]
MIYLLLSIIVLLLAVLYWQFRLNRARNEQLQEIHMKLDRILSNETSEKLLLFTEDKQLIELLIDINHVLESNQKILAERSRTELSLRRMLSNISHDLKTPLTVVLGYLETINLDPSLGTEERTELLNKVHLKATEVIELINQFFDLAKLESGDQPLPLSRIHMNEACSRNILAFYDVLTAKGFEVEIQIPEEPIYSHANESALDRILNNLLANAIQYGAAGNVVGLTLRQDEDHTYVDIWDKGKGINELYQSQVFERLYTLEDSRNRTYQGSGLGLTITKRLAQQMGGDIQLYSKPFEKTIFTLQLKRIQY